MEKNPIFDINRFTALFSTGIYRIKVTAAAIAGIFVAIFSVIPYTSFLLQNVDKDLIRSFMISLYQLSFIATLTLAAFRHMFNREKQMIWCILPASAFEKRLFQMIRVLVWNSAIFIVVYFCIDKMFWYYLFGDHDLSNYYIGLKDLFSFGAPINGVPTWINYVCSFFFMVLIPVISSGSIAYPANRSTCSFPYNIYWFFYSIALIFQFFYLMRTGNDLTGTIFKIILATTAVLYMLIDLTIAAIASCRKDS